MASVDEAVPIHPATYEVLQWFAFDHLEGDLQVMAKAFHDMAWSCVRATHLGGAECTHMVRKLLEAKDCAIRALIKSDQVVEKLERDEQEVRK
jgi:hypothetical protein